MNIGVIEQLSHVYQHGKCLLLATCLTVLKGKMTQSGEIKFKIKQVFDWDACKGERRENIS